MIVATARFDEPVRFFNQQRLQVSVGPGTLNGYLEITDFGDQARGFKSGRYIQLTFASCTVDNQLFGTLCIIPLPALWPQPGDIAKPCTDHFSPHARIKEVYDTRGLPAIRLADGTEHVTERWNKHNDVTMQFREADTGLDARLTVYAEPGVYRSFAYHIPLERVIFRPAALYHPDDVEAEKADHVFFKWIRELSKFDQKDGLRPGPIRVLSPG